MSRIDPHLDKLGELLDNISGLADIIQQDLCRKASKDETAILSDFHICCLLFAIDELANRGYYALNAADLASQEQEVRS